MSASASIFLSYRRQDTQDVAGRIFDELTARFGRHRVFKDVDSIPIASNFRQFIVDQIKASVVLVLIGPRWLGPSPEATSNRLWQPDDFVRLEIETALESNSPLVPIIVGAAAPPPAAALPPSIRALCDKQGVSVRPDPDFHADMQRLTSQIAGLLRKEDARRIAPEALDDLFGSCQAWYNDIVRTVAELVAAHLDPKLQDDERAAVMKGIELVYLHSRTYVPKVLSGRRLLARFSGTEEVARALDEFLSLIYVATNDKEVYPYCLRPMTWMFREPVDLGLPGTIGHSREDAFAQDYLDLSLSRISWALQALSDAVLDAKLAH